jgi:hypothetical protein
MRNEVVAKNSRVLRRARQLRKAVLIGSVTFALSGCVAVWGGPYEIESQTADAVAIKYDGHFIGRDAIDEIAQKQCALYSRRADLKSATTSLWGISTAVFDCGQMR